MSAEAKLGPDAPPHVLRHFGRDHGDNSQLDLSSLAIFPLPLLLTVCWRLLHRHSGFVRLAEGPAEEAPLSASVEPAALSG